MWVCFCSIAFYYCSDFLLAAEDIKIQQIQQKHEQDMKAMREEMSYQFSQIMSLIQQNPKLAQARSVNKEKSIRPLGRIMYYIIVQRDQYTIFDTEDHKKYLTK